MDSIMIGPFRIVFTPEGVEFHTSYQAGSYRLTYTECYKLLAALYQRREELYRLTYRDKEQSEDMPIYVVNDLTYTIDDTSLSVAGWEGGKEVPPKDKPES